MPKMHQHSSYVRAHMKGQATRAYCSASENGYVELYIYKGNDTEITKTLDNLLLIDRNTEGGEDTLLKHALLYIIGLRKGTTKSEVFHCAKEVLTERTLDFPFHWTADRWGEWHFDDWPDYTVSAPVTFFSSWC